jgi:hypothetical protein
VNDPAYVAWTESGLASHANTFNDLLLIFSAQYPRGSLQTYSADARYRLASGGVLIAGKPYLSDPTARNTLGSAHDFAVANPGHITDWKLADGTFIQLTEAQLASALQKMATFVQSCFTCESTTLAAITGGTITTLAQVDAAYAAISNVYP